MTAIVRENPEAACDLAQQIRPLFALGQIVELRILGVKDGKFDLVYFGFFDQEHLEQLATAALAWTHRASGCYFTVNPVDPALLARRLNRIDVARKEKSTADADVIGRRWFIVDCDAGQAAGVASTDVEKSATLKLATSIRTDLYDMGWPFPVMLDSGNGTTLLYRIDLPADDDGLVKRSLAALAAKYQEGKSHVDTKLFNAARIYRLPGTMNRKGDGTPDRPHRRSRILNMPDDLDTVVTVEQLEKLAGPKPERKPYKAPANGHRSNPDNAEKRAAAYVEKMEPSIQGCNGNGKLMAAARAAVHSFDLGVERGTTVLMTHFNSRCQPEWSEKEIRRACESADTKPYDKPRGCLLVDRNGSSNGHAHSGLTYSSNGSTDHDQGGEHNWPPDETFHDQEPASFDPPPADPDSDDWGRSEEQAGAAIESGEEEALLTDRGNAMRFSQDQGDKVRYCPGLGWLVWDGKRWKPDAIGEVMLLLKRSIRKLYTDAIAKLNALAEQIKRTPDDEKLKEKVNAAMQAAKAQMAWAHTSESTPRLKAALESAQSEPGIAILSTQLDAAIWLLNTDSGTINLRTGELLPHRKDDLITKLAPVRFDPDAKCPLWEKVISFWMNENRDLVAYKQRVIGYCLTGDVSEQCLWFLYGAGANGKSTFLKIILAMLGDYAIQAVSDLLMAKKNESHPTERADLLGIRFVATIETDEGKQMAESLMKQLTGGDNVRARKMRQDFIEFEQTWKIALAANHKPQVRGTDHGIWRRIKLLPYEVKVTDEQKDPHLLDKLKEELPGILAWAVRGCRDWQKNGMCEPDEVRLATANYRNEQDTLTGFIAELCFVHPEARVRTTLFHDAYCEWSGDRLSTPKSMANKMAAKGFESIKSTGGRQFYKGIGLPEKGDEYTESGG